MMATNTYTQHTADGKNHIARRSVKQGRPAQPVELVKVKAEFMILPATKARVQVEARRYNVSFSAYVDLAVSLFDMSKFSS